MASTSVAPAKLLTKDRAPLLEKILAAKRAKKLTWENIAGQLDLSPVFIAAVCLGQSSLALPSGKKLMEILQIENPEENAAILAEPPLRSQDLEGLSRDPFMARLQEMNSTYGLAIRELVLEKFGDGIMSAIDFKVNIDKIEDPKGDRVQITLNGKFLPFNNW